MNLERFMRLLLVVGGFLFLAASVGYAGLDISVSGRGSNVAWRLVDEKTGEMGGIFWNPFTRESDFGYETDGDDGPEFDWSPDRQFVAVLGGADGKRMLFLYRVAKNTLERVRMPQLPESLQSEFEKLGTPTESGFRVMGWESEQVVNVFYWQNIPSGPQPFAVAALRIEINGTSGKILSTDAPRWMSAVPEKHASDPPIGAFTPESLEGLHTLEGSSPGGQGYAGTVEIRWKNGLVLMQWVVGDKTTYGTGLLEGSTLGVSFEGGVAIYRIVPEGDGFGLFGIWALQGAEETGTEIIRIGSGTISAPAIPVTNFNGKYRLILGDWGNSVPCIISGGDMLKSVQLGDGRAEALALGNGLAMITVDGLLVLQNLVDQGGFGNTVGNFLNSEGTVQSAYLQPDTGE